MTTQITTSTTLWATGQGAPRRMLDRCQNGVLWAFPETAAGTAVPYYSADSGATWAAATSLPGVSNQSLFIDLDDNAHVVWVQFGTTGPNSATLTSGALYYMRGTPNTGRTAWTWSAATQLAGSANNYPDVVAFRDPVNAGAWQAVIVSSIANGTTNYAIYQRLAISSAGVIATSSAVDGLTILSGSGTTQQGQLGGGYGQASAHTYPTVDFNHTGDGKTVAGSTPHLYVGWTAGTTGTGKGVRFRKAVYASGAWTWNTEREIDNTRANNQLPTSWQSTHFDGTQIVITGHLYTGSAYDIVLHDRDAADTTTTLRALVTGATGTTTLASGAAAYDSVGNVYLYGRDGSGANGTRLVNYRKWTRSGASLGAIVTIDTTGPDAPYLSTKRSYSSSRIELLRTDYAAASPYPVDYDALSLNQAPNAPTSLSPASSTTIDRSLTQRFSWTFSDPDAGDTQSAFDLQYRIGTGAWTTVSQTTTNAFYDFAGGTFSAASYEWQVRTYDSTGTVGPWSASAFFTAASAPAAPTITAPTSGSTIASNSSLVAWSAPSQDAYQVRTVGDNAGAADTSTMYTDTGTVTDSSGRSRTVAFTTNGVYQHVQVRVQVGGLWSSWADVRVLVSYTAPATPTLTTSPDSTNARITITISDPTPTGSQPTVSSHDVYRRVAGDGTSGTRLAAAIGGTSWIDYTPGSATAYEYRVVANGSNTTSTASAWTA